MKRRARIAGVDPPRFIFVDGVDELLNIGFAIVGGRGIGAMKVADVIDFLENAVVNGLDFLPIGRCVADIRQQLLAE